MTFDSTWRRVLSVSVCLVWLSAEAVAQTATQQAGDYPGGGDDPVRICIASDGQPTDRCVETPDMSFSMRSLPTRKGAAREHVRVTFTGGWEALAIFRAPGGSGTAADEVEICIVNGANICPPEPLEIVWTCITTGMLAGSECPHHPESSGEARVSIVLQSPRPAGEICRCLFRCAGAGFFVNAQIDPYIHEIWTFGPEHCEAHASIDCFAVSKNLYDFTCS